MTMETEDVRRVINEVLDKRRGEDLDHKAHHAFVQAMITKEERKQEIWTKVKIHVLGWGIVGIVGSLGAWLLKHYVE